MYPLSAFSLVTAPDTRMVGERLVPLLTTAFGVSASLCEPDGSGIPFFLQKNTSYLHQTNVQATPNVPTKQKHRLLIL